MTFLVKTTMDIDRQHRKTMELARAKSMPIYTAQAYAEFLLSEKIRHQEDIKAIDEKLAALARKGIVPAQVGPWIKTEDIEAAVIE